jgi:hypothetical protein
VLECRLVAAESYRAGNKVLVRFVLANRGELEVSVLTWYSPLEGLLGNVFRVVDAAGAVRPYQGPMVKRGDPEADEYTTVPPKGEIAEEVDLALAYDLTAPGRYTVTFAGPIADLTTPGAIPRPRERHRPSAIQPCTARFQIVD